MRLSLIKLRPLAKFLKRNLKVDVCTTILGQTVYVKKFTDREYKHAYNRKF